jgi:hypothetical protein
MKYSSAVVVLGITGFVGFVACSSSTAPEAPVDGGNQDTGHVVVGNKDAGHGHDATKPSSGSGSGTSAPPSSGSGSGTSSSGDSGPDFDADFDGSFDGGAPLPLECTVPATSVSGGSCVTVVAANDAGTGVQCNPVTNAGCAAGSACDTSQDMNGNTVGFICYPPPPPITVAVCGMCDDVNTACVPGATCFGTCAKYCCTDADCGEGTCSTGGGMAFAPAAPTLGICLLPTDGGMGSGSGSSTGSGSGSGTSAGSGSGSGSSTGTGTGT